MNDFIRKPLSFDSAAFMRNFTKFCEGAMEACAEKLVEIVKHEIMRIGNGDIDKMRPDAARQVKEVLREVTNDHITFGVGVDADQLQSISEELYVRVMVVIFGNQGGGRLRTKPGQDTFKKYVTAKGPSSALESYDLPDEFNQFNKRDYIASNSIKQIARYFKDMINAINVWIDGNFFGGYIRGG